MMPELPFDLEHPPAEPPPGCREPEKWQRGYDLYRQHVPDRYGVCKQCRQKAPCFLYLLALRSLLDAYIGERPRHVQLPGPPRIVSTSVCRWCGWQIRYLDDLVVTP
jgi:hypothetical protein